MRFAQHYWWMASFAVPWLARGVKWWRDEHPQRRDRRRAAKAAAAQAALQAQANYDAAWAKIRSDYRAGQRHQHEQQGVAMLMNVGMTAPEAIQTVREWSAEHYGSAITTTIHGNTWSAVPLGGGGGGTSGTCSVSGAYLTGAGSLTARPVADDRSGLERLVAEHDAKTLSTFSVPPHMIDGV